MRRILSKRAAAVSEASKPGAASQKLRSDLHVAEVSSLILGVFSVVVPVVAWDTGDSSRAPQPDDLL